MSSSSPRNPHPQDAVAGHNAKSGVGGLQKNAGWQPGEQHLIERGYVPVRQLTGKVVGVWGDAHIRHLDGTVTPLHVGDVVRKGEVVLTAQDGIVQLEAHPTTQYAGASDEVERTISQVGNGDPDVVPAAGPNSGGAAGSLGEGLRVGRDAESVTPASLDIAPPAAPVPTAQAQAVTPLQVPPIANPDTETTAANAPVSFDPRSNDASSSGLTIVAVAGHPISPTESVTLPQGTVSMNADGSLTFTPVHGQSGTISFSYTETNATGGSATSTVTIAVAPEPAPTAAIGLRHDAQDDTGASVTDSLTSNKHPILDGSGQPDSTVTVTVTPAGGSPVVYNATTDASGHWSVDLSTATPVSGALPAGGLPDGTVTLGVSTVNDQGLTATATGSLQVDSTPPAASIGLQHDGANDTGASSTDSLTANPHPVLAGTGEPSSTVTITVTPNGGAPVTYTAPTDATGHWSIDTATATPTAGALPAGGLPEGPVGLQVVSTDGAGNTTTATGSFTEDQTPPAASIDLKHDGADDTGASSTDGITSNPHPVLVGTGEPASTVTITVTPNGGAPVTYTAPTDANGHWSLDTATATPTAGALPAVGLPDGPVGLQVVSTDAAGNTATATGSFTENQALPIASIDLKHDAADDTGVSSTDGITANAHPVLVGTGEPSSTVTITVTPNGGAPITYTAPTDANGDWSIDTATATPTSGAIPAGGLPDGAVSLQVVSIDSAGNTTTATGSFTEDRTAPVASIDLKHDGADDTGVSTTDGVTANTHPVLVGTGEPSSLVSVTVTPNGGSPITYTAPTDASGHWSIDTNTATPTSGVLPAGGLPDGAVGLQVVSTDAAGNTTTATGAFTEDTTPPVATITLKHDGVDDTGSSPTDGVTSNVHPVITGTGEPSSVVDVTVTPNGGAPVTYTASTDVNGNWSLDLATAVPQSGSLGAGLPDGAVGLQVSSTDAAGNTAAGTASFTITHVPPAASIDLVHDHASDTGVSDTDGITGNATPVIGGTGLANSVVHVTVTDSANNTLTYDAPTDGTGHWTIDIASAAPTSGTLQASGLADGPVSLSVVTQDVAGNAATATGAFTEDHTAQAATIGLKHDAIDDTGVSSNDGITNNATPVLTGTAEQNSTLVVTVTDSANHVATYAATSDANGNWSIDTATAIPTGATTPISGLPSGAVTLQIDATDQAGNTASGSGSFQELLPAATTIGLKHDGVDDTGTSSNDSITNKIDPVLTGTGPASTLLTVTATDTSHNTLTYQVTSDANGNWSIDTQTALTTSGTIMPAAGFANGTVALTVTGTDVAGNQVSANGSFQELLPAVTTIGLKHDGADDTGTSSTDSITNKTEPIITGTGPASTLLTVAATDASHNTLTYQVTTDASGNWSIDTSTAHPTSGTMPAAGFVNGTVTLGVSGTDVAGNQVSANGSFQEVLSPTATIGLKRDGADDTGASSTDSITNKIDPVLTGTGPASTLLTVTATDASHNTLTYQVTSDANGNWSVDTQTALTTSGTLLPAAGFANGTVTLGVSGTDIAGNQVSANGSFQELLPAATSVGLKHDGVDDTGTSSTDSITNKIDPVLTGTGPASTLLTVTATDASHNTLTYQVTSDANGNWSIDTHTALTTAGTLLPAAGFANGTVTLGVSGTDVAGNQVSANGSFQELLPAATSVGLKHDGVDDTGTSSNDSITNKIDPVLTGTGPASTLLTVTATDTSHNTLTYQVTSDANGNWSIDTHTALTTASTLLPAAGFVNGTVALTVTGTDVAGNQVSANGSFQELLPAVTTIGLKHDGADDTGTSSTDSITNKIDPVLTGTGPASTLLTVTATDASHNTLTYQVTSDANGNWSIDTSTAHPTSGTMPAAGFANGTVTLGVAGTDVAGNNVSASGSFQELLPAATTIGLKHDGADDTGTSINDSITNKTEPVITGTGPASTLLTVTATDASLNKLTYQVTTDASGNWSIDTSTAHPTSGTMPTAGFANGTVTLGVTGTDVAGNNVSASGSFQELLPAATTIGLKHDGADDTGTSINDSITNKTEPVITGTGPASTLLTVTATDASLNKLTYQVTTDASGNWSIDTSTAHPTSGTMPTAGFANGTVTLGVTGTDVAGNNVSASGSFQELLPAATTIGLKHDGADDTGTSINDSITNKTEPVITGTGPASTLLTVTATDASLNKLTYQVTTDASGNWSIDTSAAHPTSGTMPAAGFANGTVTLGVAGTDVAGNNVSASGSFQELLPAATTIGLKHDGADDTGTSINDSITNKTEPVITGTGPASTLLTVTATDASLNKLTYQVTTDAGGNWSIDTSTAHATSGTMPAAGFANGTVTLGVAGTDVAGNNVSANGSFQEVLSPTATIGLKHDGIDDTGTSSTDSITNKTDPVLTGTGPASTLLTVTATDASHNTLTYQVTSDASGNWSIDTHTAVPTNGVFPAGGFVNGSVALTVGGTDIAGNNVSANGSFQEDLTTPAPTINLQHDRANDTGISITDNLTYNGKPVLVGTAEANSTVVITVTDKNNNAVQFAASTDINGNWSIDTSKPTAINGTTMPSAGLPDGLVTLQVVATDAAGNVSVPGTSSFTEDRTITASIGLKHDAADDTGPSAIDSVTSNATPVITGTGDPNNTVQVTVTDAKQNTLTYSAVTDGNGDWSIDTSTQAPTHGTMPRDGLANGTVSLSVSSSDAAGNSITSPGSFSLDDVNHAADPTVSVNAIGRWVFNEGTGTSTTDAYNSYTGTLTDLVAANGGTAPTWIAGHNGSSGTALSFDGKGGVVSVPLADTAVLNTTSTLSVWFKTTQVGSAVGWSSPSIIGSEHQGDANDIQWGVINNKGQIGLGLGNDPTGVYSTAAVNDGQWHDLTITRTVNTNGSSVVSVYVDGTLSNSATLAAQAPATNGIPTNYLAGFGYTNAWQTTGTGTSAVNSDGTAGDVYYKGSLDDAAIYSHALTADQAKAVYLVENGFEGQAVANVGDAIKLSVADTNATALHVIGVENGMTLTDGTHTITSTGNSQVIDVTGWNLGALQLTNVGTGSATLEFNAVNTNANGQTEDSSTYLSVVNGTTLLAGTTGNDTLNASANTGATFISGGAGNDVITGGSGNDHLIGGSGKDTISGGAGNDLIDPGSGSATLTGGAGNDVFHWELADHGTAGAPSVVTITDFSSVTGNKDMLDLRDLLPGANHDGTQAGNIADYLHFDLSGSDTVIHVSTTGGFASGYSAAAENETIILKGVDLTSASSQTDSQIIHQLLANGQLHLS